MPTEPGATGVNGTCPGQAACIVGSPISKLITIYGPFTSSFSHTGFWNVPRIGGARSCLTICELAVPSAALYMTLPPPLQVCSNAT